MVEAIRQIGHNGGGSGFMGSGSRDQRNPGSAPAGVSLFCAPLRMTVGAQAPSIGTGSCASPRFAFGDFGASRKPTETPASQLARIEKAHGIAREAAKCGFAVFMSTVFTGGPHDSTLNREQERRARRGKH